MADIYLIRCLWDGAENFCIWFSDDKDGLFCDEEKRILCFMGEDATLLYLSQRNLCLCEDEDFAVYDFDRLKTWVDSDDPEINCSDILNHWNIFNDIAYTAGVKFKGDKRTKLRDSIYEKLFFGSTYHVFKPVFNPEGEDDYIPDWDKKEIKTIKTVMENGLNILRVCLKVYRH